MAAVCRYVTFSSSNKEFFIFPDKYFRALAVFAAFSKESSKFSPSICKQSSFKVLVLVSKS